MGGPRRISVQQYWWEESRPVGSHRAALAVVVVELLLAVKGIHLRVTKAGISGVLGLAGRINVQGEEVRRADDIAQILMVESLSRSGQVAGMVSEEEEKVIQVVAGKRGQYLLMFDPLDGSDNIETNGPLGTVWAVYRRRRAFGKVRTAEFLRPGTELVMAGYAIYGSSTMLVYSSGQGVHGFTLDPEMGEFYLTHPGIRIPRRGRFYAINEGNETFFADKIMRFLTAIKEQRFRDEAQYRGRYAGCMVADVHRTLLAGGVFMYPEAPNPKLRLLYEANPMAYLVEQAGGAATDGERRILEIQPRQLHERVPLILGGQAEIARFIGIK